MTNKKVDQAMAARVIDYKRTFGTDYGKRVLFDLMKRCSMLQSSYIIQDPNATIFNEGKRFMVLEILSKLKVNPNKFVEMIEEGIDNE